MSTIGRTRLPGAFDRIARLTADVGVLEDQREVLWNLRHRGAVGTRTPFVQAVLPRHGVGAELGVFRGRFSPVLFEHAAPLRLHLVDPWYLLTPTWSWGAGDRSTVNAVRRVLKRWKREIEEGRVVVHIGDDRDVLRSFDDGYLDWAYIDSSHAYDHTMEELQILDAKVRSGGVIAGDDWHPDPSHRHHGVHRAVVQFAAERRYEVIYAGDRDQQWAIRRSAG